MNTEQKQGQEFADSPIGSRITNRVRTLVRNGVADATTRELMIRHINESMRCRGASAERTERENRILAWGDMRDSEALARFVIDFCTEIDP